jgi:ketosteroid isomerase-like protein
MMPENRINCLPQLSMSEEQDILAVNHAFYRAFEKKDLDAMNAVWSKGAGSICIHPGREALRGWERISDSWQKIFRNTNYIEIDTQIITIEINGDLAYVVLIETVLQVVGRRQLQARSMSTNVFERMAKQWYLVHHHGSPLVG